MLALANHSTPSCSEPADSVSRCIPQMATLGAPALQCLKLPLCSQVLSLQLGTASVTLGGASGDSDSSSLGLPTPPPHPPACFPEDQSSFLFLAMPSTPYLGFLWHQHSAGYHAGHLRQTFLIVPCASFKRDKAYFLSPSVCSTLSPTLLHTDLVRLFQEPLYHSSTPGSPVSSFWDSSMALCPGTMLWCSLQCSQERDSLLLTGAAGHAVVAG